MRTVPKKKKTSKVQKAELKVRDLKAKKDPKAGFLKLSYKEDKW